MLNFFIVIFIVIATTVDPDIRRHILDNKFVPKFKTITLSLVLNLPSSVGHFELHSSNPFIQPKIFVNYYEKPDDLYRMMSSLKLAHEILKQPPLSMVWGVKEIGFDDKFGRWYGKDGVMNDEDWEQYICGKVIFIKWKKNKKFKYNY